MIQKVRKQSPEGDLMQAIVGVGIFHFLAEKIAVMVKQKNLAEDLDETLKAYLSPLLEKLSPRERDIIKLRYRIGDGYAYSWKEIGKIFKLPSRKAEEIHDTALEKLWKMICPVPLSSQHPAPSRN